MHILEYSLMTNCIIFIMLVSKIDLAIEYNIRIVRHNIACEICFWILFYSSIGVSTAKRRQYNSL